MNSIPLEMDDIFGEEDDVEDFNPSRLPDLEDELEPMRDSRNEDEAGSAPEETDNAELMAKLKSMKGASKHVTRKIIPKLDSTRLTGERGIPVLPRVFKDIPLKGKNHETEDLKTIMQNLEHWAHRLFPKMPFAEVLERVENLGSKKEVQSCVKRIRLDMPVIGADNVQDEADNVQRTDNLRDEADDVQRTEHVDEEDDDQRSEQSFNKENEIDDDEIEELLREQALPVSSLCRPDDAVSQSKTNDADSQSKTNDAASQSKTKTQNDITDELKAKIEQSKKLALERRAAKLAEGNKGDSPNTAIHCDQSSKIVITVDSSEADKEESTTQIPLTVNLSENIAVSETLIDNVVSDVVEVQKDYINGEAVCDEPAAALQTDKLFDEDSDSERLYMADD